MERSATTSQFYSIDIQGIDGQKLSPEIFAGKRVLIVNTASECGFTAQYAQLQELHAHFKDKVVVLGCPCNDFGGQEPGSETSIQEFCQSRFGVDFPLTAKMKIKGDDPHPLFAWLVSEASSKKQLPEEEVVQWNFTKFILDEEGGFIDHFPASEDPFSPAVLSALDVHI